MLEPDEIKVTSPVLRGLGAGNGLRLLGDAFILEHKDELRDVEIIEVNKMLSCKDESRGYFTYLCENCGTYQTIYFGCNT